MNYQVYSADRSGQSWDVFTTSSETRVLSVLEARRKASPGQVHGVYDLDDPERGDVEDEIQEALAYDESTNPSNGWRCPK